MNFEGAKTYILDKLGKELNPQLTYHSVDHTLDVLQSAIRLAEMEHVAAEDLVLLKTACLFHDTGMLVTYKGHEEASVQICNDTLPLFGYNPGQIKAVTEMILTTQLPQSASYNLDKILCDADLDYLGRPDYFMIAHKLKYEWEVLDIYKTSLHQWYKIQKDFLTNHRYFTPSAIETRQESKLQNLGEILAILNHEK
jgi:predicted metal-dependent HD superfamily phosphohydrolase